MKLLSLVVVALVAVAFSGVAQAGPTSPLYLTYVNGGGNIIVVQGNSVINSFPQAYGNPFEIPIAVWGDVRTAGQDSRFLGGQYSLAGTPTGTTYVLPSFIDYAFDSTSDGSHNYVVDFLTGTVYQTARDFSSPVTLFNAGANNAGITYDPANRSLWFSGWSDTLVTNYSLSGVLLSSFSTGHNANGALALDPADHTLWLVNDSANPYTDSTLEQYSTAGVLLSTGPTVGYSLGGEFNAVPEPGTLIMLGSGILGLAGVLRRKINL